MVTILKKSKFDKIKDTWLLALQYLIRLSEPDAERIENEIIECELVSNRQAESVYNLPLKLQLPNATAVQNRIASKYGKYSFEYR